MYDMEEQKPAQTTRQEQPGSPSFLQAMYSVWVQRKTVFHAIYIGMLVSTIYVFWVNPEYASTTRLMPPNTGSVNPLAMISGTTDDRLASLAADALGIKSSGALYTGILSSRTLLDRLVDEFDLKKEYKIYLQGDARTELSQRTSINEDRKNGILAITVTDSDPHRARDLADAYVDELNRLYTNLNSSAARREREFLEGRLKQVKNDLDGSSEALSRFSSKSSTFEPITQTKAMLDAAAKLQGELIAADAQLSSLEQIYTQQNVRVRAASAHVDELRRQLRMMAGTAAPGSDDISMPSLRDMPEAGVKYYDLYRTVKIQEAVFETLTKQYELAKVQEAREVPTVKVLDTADYPETKVYPRRIALIFLGSTFGLIMGVLFVMICDWWKSLEVSHPIRQFILGVSEGVTHDFANIRLRLNVNRGPQNRSHT